MICGVRVMERTCVLVEHCLGQRVLREIITCLTDVALGSFRVAPNASGARCCC